jgi:methanogenic corrinoid protein MtbC1
VDDKDEDMVIEITKELYQSYLSFLLQGKRTDCSNIVLNLIQQGIEIKNLYTNLFQNSLYDVGKLWEFNKISVAHEHLATAITEGLLNLVYPQLFKSGDHHNKAKKVVISCAANELHQIGGKMVADIFQLQGWEGHFLGANTPVAHMLKYIQDTKPDLVGLSLSVYFNIAALKTGIEAIQSNFANIDIFVGGQAFKWGGTDLLKKYNGIYYIHSLEALEAEISG